MSWYYNQEGKQVGPVSETEFRSLVASGGIKPETLVWREGMPEWKPYRDAVSAGPARTSDLCSQCGRTFPIGEMIQYAGQSVCAECKPIFLQKLKEGVAPTASRHYGGFWIRFGARLIDGIILWVVNVLVAMPVTLWIVRRGVQSGAPDMRVLAVQAMLVLVQFGIGISYEVLFLGKFAATPGKLACSLRVITTEGGRVSYLRALGRYFGTILSSLILMIGFLMAAFDDQKRALHDRICDTRVVKV